MSESRKRAASSSRRNFLKAAAGVTANKVLIRQPLRAQSSRTRSSSQSRALADCIRSI
jgi:hypothetical protein